MLELKPVELADKTWIDPIVKAENSRSADYNFGNIYLWDPSYHQLIGRIGDRCVVQPCYRANRPFFAFPIGTGDLVPVILALKDYAGTHGFSFTMRGVTENHKKDLEELFPGHFQFEEDRDYWDYIYLAEKLATLSGKKLHGKRNHINRFIEEHTWSFQPITREIVPACMDMLAQWTTANADQLYDGVEEEHVAIVRAFENFDALDLEGGGLFSEDRLIAFTIGEKIADDTFNIHFEKAYSDIQGAYPMVSREFVRQILARHPEIVYINREDDMGKENLRRAKLNYFPAFMVEKYTAIWRD